MKPKLTIKGALLAVLAPLVSLGATTSCAATVGTPEIRSMVPFVRLDPPKPGANSLYVDFRDSTFTEGLGDEVYYGLEDALQDKGWVLTDDFNESDYALFADIRIFEEAGTEAGNKALAGLGAFASGVAIGAATYEATDNWWLSAGAGGIGGAMIGKGIEWATRKKNWQMVIDIELGQRVPGGVETTESQDSATAIRSITGMGNKFGAETAESGMQSSKKQERTQVRVHFEKQQRLLVTVGGRRCPKELAKDALIPRLIEGVAGQMPRIRRSRN